MKNYAKQFIEFAINKQVLRFGEFTLKSGRISPYFFNAGQFNSGSDLAALGKFNAAAICDSQLSFDVLFGPAYKGIPLVTATAMSLALNHDIDRPYAFNRKEVKTRGEGGVIVGAKLANRVLIIDDVITAGTAINEAFELISAEGAQIAGVVIALDRQEVGQGKNSAIEEIKEKFNIPVIAIATLDDVVQYLKQQPNNAQHLANIERYREQYGVAQR